MKLLERVGVRFTGLIACVGILAVAVLLGLVETCPYRPRTALGWLLFVLLAFRSDGSYPEPLKPVGDRDPAGQWVNRRTASKRFSWMRALYLLLRTFFLLALIMLTIWLAVSYVPALRDQVSRHFGQ